MLDQLIAEKPKRKPRRRRRKKLPFWAMLLIWLVMSTGFAAYNWFLVRQDERIAPKEQIALGSVYKSTNGRHGPHVFYSFSYDGKEYHGDEGVANGSFVGKYVAVYLDPKDPATNTLTEYRLKGKQDHGVMVGCGYASEGLAVILAFVLWRKRSKAEAAKDHYPIG